MQTYLSLLLLFLCGTSWSILVDDVRENVIEEIEDAWKELKGLRLDNKQNHMKELAELLKNVTTKISQVERELYDYEEAIKLLGRKVENTSSSWREKWMEITVLLSPIDVIYGYFRIFLDMPESFVPGSGIMDFDASTITNLILKPVYSTEAKKTNTLIYLTEHAHSAIVHDKDLFSLLRQEIESKNWCNEKTPQRVIYGIYTTLLLVDIKEYTVINFAWMLQYVMNGTLPRQSELVQSTQTLRVQSDEKKIVAKKSMKLASNAYWKCDPITYEEGENYEQFKELLQGYIENEVRMQPKSSCKQSCDDFTFVKSRCSYPDDEACFKHRVCTGNIIECKYIAADATACLADAPRRFDYIDYKRGPLLGKSLPCNGDLVRRDSYWRFFYHCSNCFCLCDDSNSPTTVRRISLAAVTSDINFNKIVTGVRFVMKDGILRVQIEEGKPAKSGIISGSTKWKEVPKINKHDDVMQLDYMNRALDLDEVKVPPSYVVTGVRFRHLGSHVNMEVQATQINPITAELVHSSQHWISNDNTPETDFHPRIKLNLNDADIPTLTDAPSLPDSAHDQYIEFGATSRAKDVAQTTIPFIDIQPVRPNPPVWLQGISIYHKGRKGYGGFIGFKIWTSDLSEFLEDG